MAIFKVPCPSCEAQVLIKNPKLVGTKVECPKCKYRFKVEPPADAAAEAETPKADKPAEKAIKKPAKTGKKNKKLLLGLGLGAAAILILGVGFFVFFGESSDLRKPIDTRQAGKGVQPSNKSKDKGKTDKKDKKDKEKEKEKEKEKTDHEKPVTQPPPTGIVASDKEPANLLPTQTVAVYRFNIDRLRQAPAVGTLVDPATTSLLQLGLGFNPDQVTLYYHCLVGPARTPFGIVRLAAPMDPKRIASPDRVLPEPKSVKGKDVYTLAPNPFIPAAAEALSARGVFADFFDRNTESAAAPAPPPGLCVYDAQTVLIASPALLEQYLTDLQANGYPTFQPDTANPPMFRTLPTPLRRLLTDLEREPGSGDPYLLFADTVPTPSPLDPKLVKRGYRPAAESIAAAVPLLRYFGGMVTTLSTKQLTGMLRLVGETPDETRTVARERVSPAVKDFVDGLTAIAKHPVEYKNLVLYPAGGLPPPTTTPPTTVAPPPVVPPGTTPPVTPKVVPLATLSKIELQATDNVITLSLKLGWTEEFFNQSLAPRILSMVNEIKGKMAVIAGKHTWYSLAAAGPAAAKAKKQFPRGTADRKVTGDSRLGLPYPPNQRVSFFPDLFPFLGTGERTSLGTRIDRNKSWADDGNLTAAEEWVPELLVPYYPASAWRATSPQAEGRVLGGTNYVAVAGVGPDAARFNPLDPARAKVVGMTGYDWGSKPEEVTDGLSNTMYLLQVKPGLPRPWIAGGGATVMGINPTNPMAEFAHDAPGKGRGTYALMGDGSVRWVPATIDPRIFLGMSTRAGGEDLAGLDQAAPKLDGKK